MKRDEMMMHYRPQERPFVERMVDLARRAEERHVPVLTDFLDPRQTRIAQMIVGGMADVNVSTSGGHEGAERQRALLVPSYYLPEPEEFQLAFLRIEVPGDTMRLQHGDFLGALIGVGLKRTKLGDLSVHEQGCDLTTAREIADFIRLNLTQVGRANVYVSEIAVADVRHEPVQLQEKTFTVQSLRVDAIAAEAFGVSRAKVVDPIKSGKLQLNWQIIDSPATPVEEGDVLSLRGFGRVRILEVGGESKKGRTFVTIGKYL